MKSEIISIGTELLVGSILNTNAQFLSQVLAQNGIDVYHQVTVGDNVGRIAQALENAAKRADLIVTSGGLGPTEDDVTLEAVAKFLDVPLALHQPTYDYVFSRLKKRGLGMTKIVEKLCWLPKSAVVFKNEFGTAPGLLLCGNFTGRKIWVLVLPGPPRELEPLFKKILPQFIKKARIPCDSFVIRSLKISGLMEHQVAQKTNDLLKLKPPTTVGIYAKPGEVELKIMSKASSKPVALRQSLAIERIIRKRLGKNIYGKDQDTLGLALGDLLRRRHKTLAIAESCTGGLLGHMLTEVSGSSDYFLGGVIAYANTVKTRELGVPSSVLQKHGAVSAQTARHMAQGVQKKFKSDIGVGITGIAGPSGGTKQKPVGLVCIALSSKNKTRVKKLRLLGERGLVKFRAAQEALNLLRLFLLA